MGWVPHPEERYLFEWDKDGEKHTTRGGAHCVFPSSLVLFFFFFKERERERQRQKNDERGSHEARD